MGIGIRPCLCVVGWLWGALRRPSERPDLPSPLPLEMAQSCSSHAIDSPAQTSNDDSDVQEVSEGEARKAPSRAAGGRRAQHQHHEGRMDGEISTCSACACCTGAVSEAYSLPLSTRSRCSGRQGPAWAGWQPGVAQQEGRAQAAARDRL